MQRAQFIPITVPFLLILQLPSPSTYTLDRHVAWLHLASPPVLHCCVKRRPFHGTFPCKIPYLFLIAHCRSILTRIVVLWTNWGLGFLYFTMVHVSPLHVNLGMNVLSEPVSQDSSSSMESLVICHRWFSVWLAVKQYSLFYS